MKLSRRLFFKLAGAAGGAAGCATEDLAALPWDDDAATEDVGPDPTFDADPLDPDVLEELDAGAADDVFSPDATAADTALARDAGMDAGARDVPAPPRDVPAPPRDVAAPRDVINDTGARPDVIRDAGVVVNPDFRGLTERPAQFPLAVMAGDANDTSAIFWTRFDGSGPLVLAVLEMDGNRIVASRFRARVAPASGGYVRAVVTGLRADRVHLYAFLVGPEDRPTGRSAVGRVRTAMAADAMRPITFAGTACTNQSNRPFPVLQHAGSRTDLDFFIHCGDHTYTDHGTNATSLSDYRTKYEENWSSAGMRALHRSAGMVLTWDDHEVLNNWNPETIAPGRLAAARQAFFEHRATRRNSANPDRLWRSFRWGRTAEVFVLDCRSERRPSTRSADPSRTSYYLSRAQMDWLKSGIRSSPCVFKFIVNSVPIVDRGGSGTDNWNGYASQRREILQHIASNNLRGVVWLSGDVHFGAVCRVEGSGAWNDIWEVIMGPSGANRDSRPDAGPAQFPVLVHNVHNYTVLRADPSTRTLAVESINAAGNRIPGSAWSRRF